MEIQVYICRYALFPAHAGVIPIRRKRHGKTFTVPRTRGGDPTHVWHIMVICHCSPHTRG